MMKRDWMKNWVLKHKSISVVLSIIGILFGTSFFIHIINIQSYPFVGDPWTTNFTVVGKGDLKVTPFNGTFFGEDINFTSLRCGDNIVLPSIITDEYVLFKDYYCFFESHFEVDVLTTGKHSLMFDFGGSLAYAYNNASVKEEVKEVVWKDNCQVKCVNNKCNRVIGRTFYANDTDGVCKPIEKARSLKNSPLKLVVEGDGYHLVEVVDYNLTAVKLKLKIKDKIQKKSVPLKIIKPIINISSDEEKQEFVKKKFSVEKSKENLVFNSPVNPVKEYDKIVKVNFLEGEFVKFGENSTTIKLQDADTENLGDSTVKRAFAASNFGNETSIRVRKIGSSSSTQYRSYIKFNTSIINVSGTCVLSSTLHLRAGSVGYNNDSNVSIHKVYNASIWQEDTITWNNQPCGTSSFNNGVNCNLTESDRQDVNASDVWYVWDVLDSTNNEISNSWSIKWTNEMDGVTATSAYFHSKEYSTASLRPYLNITYTESATTPTTIQCNGSNDCNITWTNESLTLNCSGSTDADNDVITYSLEKGNRTYIDFCNGTAYSCSFYTNETACNYDAGCSWGVGRTAELYSDNFQDGSNWLEQGDCAAYIKYGSSTPSSGTGPQNGDSDDNTNNFVYIETTDGNCDGSPSSWYLVFNQAIDWDAQEGENVTFYTNRHGTSDLGTMIVQENSTGSWVQLGSYSQTGPDGNNGLVWTKHSIDASNLTGVGWIRFYSYGHSSFEGDAAIDWFNITYRMSGYSCSGTPDPCGTYNGSETNCTRVNCSWNEDAEIKDWSYIGNHTNGTTYSWNVSSINNTNNWDLRCRAIDLDGSNTYSSYYTKNAHLNISISGGAPPSDTCSCPSPPSNWRINMPDHCNITSDCDINGYNLSFENGTSTDLVNISATIVCDNLNHNTTGIVHIDSNGYIYINKT